MSRTYYYEKMHELPQGWVTKFEQMQKNHVPLAVLWNPAAEQPYHVQYGNECCNYSDAFGVLIWIKTHDPKLIIPYELIKEVFKEHEIERKKENLKIIEHCNDTINGLIKAEAHLTPEGKRDYDKVDYSIVEDAIALLKKYGDLLRDEEE